MDDFNDLFPVNDLQSSWKKKNQKGVSIKQGKFTEEEIEKVKESLISYALSQNLTEEQFADLFSNSQKTTMPKAWLQIAKVLPERSVDSVYKFIKARFNPDNYQGHWTKEEEQHLLQLINQFGRNYTQISKILNRTPQNIRDKYRQLGDHNHELRELVWTLGEAVHLLRLISKKNNANFIKDDWLDTLIQNFGEDWQDVILTIHSQKRRFRKGTYYEIQQEDTQTQQLLQIIDLKKLYSTSHKDIPWTKIATKIKTKSHDDLRNFWMQSLNQWQLQVKLKIDDQQLFNDIILQDPQEEQDIDFNLVLKHFNLTKNEKKNAWETLKKRVQVRDQLEFEELLTKIRQLLSKSKKEQKQNKIEQKNLNATSFNKLVDEFKALKEFIEHFKNNNLEQGLLRDVFINILYYQQIILFFYIYEKIITYLYLSTFAFSYIFLFSNVYIFQKYIFLLRIIRIFNKKKVKQKIVFNTTEITFYNHLPHNIIQKWRRLYQNLGDEYQTLTYQYRLILLKMENFIIILVQQYTQSQRQAIVTKNKKSDLFFDIQILISQINCDFQRQRNANKFINQFYKTKHTQFQTQVQSNQQEESNQNCIKNVTKQHLEETKPPENQDNQDFDMLDEHSDGNDEDYSAKGLNDNQEKSYAVNQLNGSTNIQKNYAKAVILYIKQQNAIVVSQLGDKKALKFYRLVKKMQNNIRNLSHISKYTRDEDFIKIFRILCNKFLRKDCISYIYNSKIQQKTSHLKGKHIIKKNLFKI
ncbi:unnamed protein product [Paramecium pentaurelia]|uniref:Myb-like DNA-binding domain protein n=1 Tax=Paramecium pentaurelia TaxID=43138 RepID=A0A8S1URG7_9CILI|nr:unnamed protein product [Paramecium pentaurelia]